MLFSIAVTREILFFIFSKKVYKQFIDRKIYKLINGKISLSDNRIDDLIVSLTSIPSRINEVKYTLFSLLTQTMIPEKIVLWLTESQFPQKERDLPDDILNLMKFNIEVRWYSENIRVYTKLIPSLEYFPDQFIVTADDDIYYKNRWLEKLWRCHLENPDDVICHCALELRFDNNNTILPYKTWRHVVKGTKASFLYFLLGSGGVLYHKKFFFKDVLDRNKFIDLSPYADDIWLYFMVILNNTKIRVVKNPYISQQYVNPYREYSLIKQYRLQDINEDNNQNDIQLKKVLDYYGLNLYDYSKYC
jgi:hypothetical protein